MKTNFFEKDKNISESVRVRSDTRYARKWNHYLKLYDEIWAAFEKPPKVCEVGIDRGDSLNMFSPYSEVVIGIDRAPPLCEFPENVLCKQCDQSETEKMVNIISLYSPLDIIIDDASHNYDLTKKTFLNLFPLLRDNGKYIIEDWGAWSQTGGIFHHQQTTLDRPIAMLPFIKELIDELAIWGGTRSRKFGNSQFAKIEIYENILVIHKNQ